MDLHEVVLPEDDGKAGGGGTTAQELIRIRRTARDAKFVNHAVNERLPSAGNSANNQIAPVSGMVHQSHEVGGENA